MQIVRNKAAEKAKHVHHQQQQQQQQSGAQHGQGATSSVSVIAHAPAAHHAAPQHHGDPQRATGAYSINGILGIPQQPDPNGNIPKRKRDDHHAEATGLHKIR
uniref:(California timema) hypothetical protein n=1 Tax=Timema californicum TaxID=61474 RepID=A0A7R9P3E0_TIMCA|nr:unnamed protein product [Timema californicum]